MKNIFIIAGKELKSYFISPIAYVITTVFLVITGYKFYTKISAYSLECFKLMNYSQAVENLNINVRVFYSNFYSMANIVMFMMPIITMRIFAEEKRNKTLELLITSPVTVPEIVFGKFLASLFVYILMISLTIYMPISGAYFTSIQGGVFDWGAVWASYLGILLIGSVFLAIGIFASSLSENQIVAALISFVIIMMFVIIQWVAGMMEGTFAKVLQFLSLSNHLIFFFRGVLDSSDTIYFLSFTALGLFLTFRVIESKRWA